MKKVLSEKNIAALLFLLVFIVFSFAHEDSKKRYSKYNTSILPVSSTSFTSSLVNNIEDAAIKTDPVISIQQK